MKQQQQYQPYNGQTALAMTQPIRIVLMGTKSITGFDSVSELSKWLRRHERADLFELAWDEYRKMYIDYDSSVDDDVDPQELVEYLQFIVQQEIGKEVYVECYTSNRKDKVSYHLVVQGYAFHYLHCKKIAKLMHRDYPAVDLVPYGKTQQFRLYSAHKGGREDGVKTHVDDNRKVQLRRLEASLIQWTEGCERVPFTPPVKDKDPQPQGELSDQSQALLVRCLSPQRASDYEHWLRVGMAMKQAGFDSDVFHTFSAKCEDKYDYDEVEEWYERSQPNGLLGLKSLVEWAMEDESNRLYGLDDQGKKPALMDLHKRLFPKKRLARKLEERQTFVDYDTTLHKWHDEVVYLETHKETDEGETKITIEVDRWREFYEDWTKCLVYIMGDNMKESWACCRIREGREAWCMGGDGVGPIPKTWCVKVNGKRVPICKLISNASKRFTYATGYKFTPTTTELIVDQRLNTFTGLQAKEVDYEEEANVLPFLDHIRYVFADGDDASYQWILNWYAWIVQKRYKAKVALVLYSEGQQTTGKSLFNESFAKYILGRQYFAQYSSVSNLFERFNVDQMNNLFVVLDEAIFSGNKADADKLKSLITQDDLRYEIKGGMTFMGDNYANYAILTNNVNPVHLEGTDRRYALFHCNETWCEGSEYFSFLAEAFKDPQMAGQFYDYLLKVDLSGWHPQRSIPMTAYKRDVMSISKDPLQTWWEEVMDLDEEEEGEDDGGVYSPLRRGKWNPTQRIFQHFRDYCESNGYKHDYINVRKLSLFVKSKGLEDSRGRVGGTRLRGYVLP